jgi:hypothetical protein
MISRYCCPDCARPPCRTAIPWSAAEFRVGEPGRSALQAGPTPRRRHRRDGHASTSPPAREADEYTPNVARSRTSGDASRNQPRPAASPRNLDLTDQRQRGEPVGWYFYDWADSAFSTSVVTVFLGPYLGAVARRAAGCTADGVAAGCPGARLHPPRHPRRARVVLRLHGLALGAAHGRRPTRHRGRRRPVGTQASPARRLRLPRPEHIGFAGLAAVLLRRAIEQAGNVAPSVL